MNRVVGVYLVGSLALGDYRPAQSDIDVYVIVVSKLTRSQKREVARNLSHRAMACPATRLELVVVTAEEALAPSAPPLWELNFNTGSGEADHLGLDPVSEPSHWFVLDLALASERGVSLLGPPAGSVIVSPPVAQIRAAQRQAIIWYAEHAMPAEAAIAACRAWHWQEQGGFASKNEALSWARARFESGSG
jgi:hypothetical protein